MKYLLLLIIASLSSVAMAGMSPKPDSCPTIASIQMIGFKDYNIEHYMSTDQGEYWFASLQRERFGTKNTWHFNISPFVAKNKTEAWKKAKEILETTNFVEGPYEALNAWHCAYRDNNNHYSIAYTPTYYE